MNKLEDLIEKLQDKGFSLIETYVYLSSLGIIGIYFNDPRYPEIGKYRRERIQKEIEELLIAVDFMVPNWK